MSEIDIVQATKEYYDNKETDEYYHHIWGGDDMHVGIYDNAEQNLKEAAQNTTLVMLKKLPNFKKSHKILDIGAGYGGAARYIAETFGCKVECFNLSEKQNKRNVSKIKAAGLDSLISVSEGNFEQLPYDHESYDFIWSQDALFHSNNKGKILREISWVLKPGGRFVFTDIMQNEGCPQEVLTSTGLPELGSVKDYERLLGRTDLEMVFVKEMPEQLQNHYEKVLATLKDQADKIAKKSSKTYIQNKTKELQTRVDAVKNGHLTWGILQFQKRNM